jgi:hypothetical protein
MWPTPEEKARLASILIERNPDPLDVAKAQLLLHVYGFEAAMRHLDWNRQMKQALEGPMEAQPALRPEAPRPEALRPEA